MNYEQRNRFFFKVLRVNGMPDDAYHPDPEVYPFQWQIGEVLRQSRYRNYFVKGFWFPSGHILLLVQERGFEIPYTTTEEAFLDDESRAAIKAHLFSQHKKLNKLIDDMDKKVIERMRSNHGITVNRYDEAQNNRKREKKERV